MPKLSKTRTILLSSHTQLAVGFLIPTIILLYFSDESRLGPLWAMVVALIFPLALEFYSLRIRRKPSYISLMAIIGILIIGAISLLGLSEEWLALRRSIVYVIAAFGLIIALRYKRGFVDMALARVINMDAVHAAAHEKGTQALLARYINKAGYIFAVFLLLTALVSYITTMIFITAPTGTSEFNTEYAQLRILSILFITLPLIIGTVGLFIYLGSGIEKLTGLKTEELLKKKN